MPTKIDWCDETINPLGYGCYGPGGTADKPKICSYCYAYKLAKRGMRECELCKKFIPHTHFEQLEKLNKWKKPRNIFVCSMADLFGEWVPQSWIEEVFKACKAAPQHNYLFLTKNPKRYIEAIPHRASNIWFGTTVTGNDDHQRAWKLLNNTLVSANKFLSIEPMVEEFDLNKYELLHRNYKYRITIDNYIDWVIVGAETGNRKNKIIPKRKWIDKIVEQCRVADVPVFMKDSLKELMGDDFVQEFPEGLVKNMSVG